MREQLINLIAQALDTPREKYNNGCYPELKEHIADYLIAHGVVIPVRCEHCKLSRDSENNFDWNLSPLKECNICTIPNRPHEYCSWGEEEKDEV